MRYSIGFLCALTAGAALPSSASAQDADGVDVVPSAPRSGDEYIVMGEEMKLHERVARARAGLIGTSVVTAIGVPLLAVGLTYDRRQQPSEGFDFDFTGVGLTIVGGVMLIVGFIGMAASGAVMGASKQELRELKEARYEGRRRAQWDLARSRLVF